MSDTQAPFFDKDPNVLGNIQHFGLFRDLAISEANARRSIFIARPISANVARRLSRCHNSLVRKIAPFDVMAAHCSCCHAVSAFVILQTGEDK